MPKIKTFGMNYNGEWGKDGVEVICFDADAGTVDNAKTLAYVMKMYGLEETVEIKGGNCLPFHDEILDEALGIYNWEVNGVAG